MTEQLAPNAVTLKFQWGEIKHLFRCLVEIQSDSSCEVDVDYTTREVNVYQCGREEKVARSKNNVKLIEDVQCIYLQGMM